MATAATSDQMFSFKMPKALYERLARFADAERRSKGFIARDALEAYLATHEITHIAGDTTKNHSDRGEKS